MTFGVFDNEDLESVFIELNDINLVEKSLMLYTAHLVIVLICSCLILNLLCKLFLILNMIVLLQEIGTLICLNILYIRVLIVNNLHANLLIPVITRPTKFAEFSSTLIDNILTSGNKLQDLLIAGALISDISDHLPIFFVSKRVQKKIKQNYSTTSYRVMTPHKIEEVKTALTNNDWSELNVATAAYELFINRFLKIYDEKLSITHKRTKPYSYSKIS